MKFGQLIEYKMRNIFFQTSYKKWGGRLDPELWGKSKWSSPELLIQRYAQFWLFRKGSGNSFSTTFYVWFFKKNVSLVKFY